MSVVGRCSIRVHHDHPLRQQRQDHPPGLKRGSRTTPCNGDLTLSAMAEDEGVNGDGGVSDTGGHSLTQLGT